MSEVLTIGEPMAVFASTEADVPLAVACNYDKFLAGAEVNVAVGVARLGHTVDYVAQVGADPIGDFVRAELTKANVGTDRSRCCHADAYDWVDVQATRHGGRSRDC